MKIYRENNIEAEKERHKYFVSTHKEYLQEYRRQWRNNNKQYLKQYYQKNKHKPYYKFNKRRCLKKQIACNIDIKTMGTDKKRF